MQALLSSKKASLIPALLVGTLMMAGSAHALFGEAAVPRPVVPKNNEFATKSKLAAEFLMLGVTRAGTSNRTVAVGEYGHVLLSDDEGKTWRQAQSVPAKITLTSVSFVDDKTGWAVGHDSTVIKTTDGGETWTRQFGGKDSDNALLTVMSFDANRALALGAFNYTLETNDGGTTWVERKTLIQATAPAAPAAPPAGGTAPAVPADENLQAEADKEAERKAAESGVGSAYSVSEGDDAHLHALFTAPNNLVFVAAERGLVYRSTDSGRTFARIETGYAGSFWGGTALADGSLIIVGMRGNIWRSVDQGMTWAKVETPGADQSIASAIQRTDGSIVAVGLSGSLLLSTDGGKSFKIKYRDDRKGLNALMTTSDGRLIVMGEAGIADVTKEVETLGASAAAPGPSASAAPAKQ
ncbi:MAG TPA: glycosyl hydrolase [Alphaproteobacteria bacterium]|nr:glycosyl hydrolase [Alphaproteobacteria bacterium]